MPVRPHVPIRSRSRSRSRALALVLVLAAACASSPKNEPPRGYGVVVTVSALAGTGLVLQVNGGDDLPIPASGTYRFQRGFAGGDAWVVTVAQHPTLPSQHCEVANGQGTIDASDVTGTQVVCHSAWKQVSGGYEFNVGVRPDGTLWAWGVNGRNQLGDGAAVSTVDPTQIGTATSWVAVAAGQDHALALRADGTLWGWGANDAGQLGDGTRTQRATPVRIGTEASWAEVATGGYWGDNHEDVGHTLALKTDGTLWGWGDNRAGQLGNGTDVASLEPLQVGTATDWARVWAGPRHSLAQKRDGTLWAWGWNGAGQLGLGHTSFTPAPAQIDAETAWTAVAAGAAHTVALKSDGSLWAWGDNSFGALGVGTTTSASSVPIRVGTASDWRAVAAGGRVSSFAHVVIFDQAFAVKADGTLWGWGTSVANIESFAVHDTIATPVQQGTGSDWSRPIVGTQHVLGLKRDGTLRRWGTGAHGVVHDPTQVGTAADWTTLAPGPMHVLALRTDGTLWSWGRLLGTWAGPFANRPVQVGSATTWAGIAAGAAHSLGVMRDGSLWSWGQGADGELATTTSMSAVPVQIGTSYTAVAAGNRFSHGRRTDGTVSAWGYNGNGELGTGTTSTSTPQPMVGGYHATWMSVSAGYDHVLGLTTAHGLRVWGSNAQGKLGLGAAAGNSVRLPTAIPGTWAAVAAGVDHSLGIKEDGTLWGWGSNAAGQLGTGEGAAAQTADPVQVGTLAGWASVSAGKGHSLGIRADGTLWAWGSNVLGQLGIGLASVRQAPAPVQVGTGSDWAAVAAGHDYTVARKRDGTLWGWGTNDVGQLGIPYVRVP